MQEKATENMQRSYSKKAFPCDNARFHIPKVILSILSGVVRSTLMLLPTMMLQRLINSVTGDQAQSANTAVYGFVSVDRSGSVSMKLPETSTAPTTGKKVGKRKKAGLPT